ncbi:MAG: DUF4391 domain-containing protein [Desulfobacterales bacterium]|nr:DUF4391 domain-containing protein [Desulfobacterales bacterium]
MFIYPAKAEFNRALPKVKIYTNARPSKSVKARFVSQISEIVWKYKLSPETTNLAARDGFTEIQVFEITLKEPELDSEVLIAIDKAIPYPILYRLLYEGRIKRVAAYKRPAADSSGKWLTETYFETDWTDDVVPVKPLPVALDMKTLYEQVLFTYIDLPPRTGESLDVLVERVRMIRKCQRDLRVLEARMNSEKQFNRKVELNTQVRGLNAQLAVLTDA